MQTTPLDPARYADLVHAAAAPAWRAARRVTRDEGLASDAVQEAFLRLVDGRATSERLAVHGDVTQGLVALAVRVALDDRRSGARRRAREERRAMEREDDTTDPAAGLERREAERALGAALAELPERLRLAVELRFREGLSFAAVGRALGLSESSAHERVGQALARLRARVRPEGTSALLGLVGGAPRLAPPADPAVLSTVAPGAADGLPHGLVDALLALPGAARGVAAAAAAGAGVTARLALVRPLALALLGLGSLGLVAAVLAARTGAPREASGVPPGTALRAVAAVGAGAPGSDASGAAQGAPRAQDAPPARRPVAQDPPAPPAARDPLAFVLEGRVRDARGHAVPAATVRAATVERAGKFPRWTGATVADAEGRYRLVVPFGPRAADEHAREGLGGLDTARLVLEAGRLGYVLRTDVTVDAARGAAAVRDLVVALPPEERAGAYTLDLLVRDASGAPVPDALVDLTHVAPRDRARVDGDVPFSAWSSEGEWLHLAEARGRTGPDGRVQLAGERLGPKSLWIEPRAAAAPLRTALTIGAEGAHARDVVLAEGRALRGRFRWVEAGPLSAAEARALNAHVILEQNRWRQVVVGEEGDFVVDALPAGAATLRVTANHDWPDGGGLPSDVTLDLATGDGPHVLELKREDDPRDVGLHDAELHGVALDAATGEPVPIAGFDLFVWPLWELPEGDLELDVRPNVIHAPPVQRMAGPGPARETSEFHAVGRPAGAYMVQVSVRGRGAGVLGPVVLGPREVRRDLVVRVGPTAAVDVTVVDAAGAPVEGAYVFVTGSGPYSDGVVAGAQARERAGDGRAPLHVNGGRRTDAAGRARLGGLPPGLRFTVAAVHAAAGPGRSAALTAGADGQAAARLVLGGGG